MKLLIFDGNSILNRAYYAIRTLNTASGQPTNGIFGFLKLYHKYFNLSKPDMVAVAFDLREKTFRHKMYADYKAQRKGMPEELALQVEPLKEVLRAMNVKILELAGYEADDIIGTVSRYCVEQGYECDIVSGDRDDFQLAEKGVRILMPVTRAGVSEMEIYDTVAIREKYGLEPAQLIDVKSIQGDTSDNIKGVPGIGEKGALELIRQYGSLEGVYAHLEEIKPALQAKLENGRESAFLSYELAKICKEVPVELSAEELQVAAFDEEPLIALLQSLELNSILQLFDLKATEPKETPDRLEGTAAEYLSYFQENGLYFIRTDGFYARYNDKVVCLADGETLLSRVEQIYTHDAKPFYGVDFEGEPYFDTMVAAYVADPSERFDLPYLLKKYTGKAADTPEDCVAALPELCDALLTVIKENGQEKLLYEVELPLTVVLADMEERGFSVEKERLAAYTEELGVKIEQLEKEIHALAGEEFNINSPRQLGEILFVKMGLKGGKKTKTGYSTNAEVLEKLKDEPIVEKILTYRKYAKLRSTYGEGLLKLIGEDGRIRSTYNQTVTATGRISSSEPNLQNIPVREPLGRELRKMFVAKDENYLLLDADYSQIELRVLAHIAKDETMIRAFKENEDIHTVTAATVFGVPAFMVTAEMRRHAKAVNFGIVYGISDFSLAGDIGVSKKEAKAYMDQYFAKYSGVRAYMDGIVEQAKKDGYVTTLMGRRRYLPELKSSNFIQRSFGERVALNTPIQGTAADIIKIAMVRVWKQLKAENLDAHLILQVHDELIIECAKPDADRAAILLRREMEGAAELSVSMLAEVARGESWYDCK
ncbi:MAG: DNA polymerase I [Clostridia bacterium]|nr:DNA polymerase I [Clostridia bacterium]